MKDKMVHYGDKEHRLRPLQVEVHDQDRLEAALKGYFTDIKLATGIVLALNEART